MPKVWSNVVELKRLGTKDGKLKKNQAAYRPLAEAVGRELARVRTERMEAERFCEQFSCRHKWRCPALIDSCEGTLEPEQHNRVFHARLRRGHG